MKKLDNLLAKTGISIAKNDTFTHGRFTVVELTDTKGHSAVGIARQSDLDRNDPQSGYSIARGRAEASLYKKLMHRKIQHPFMG